MDTRAFFRILFRSGAGYGVRRKVVGIRRGSCVKVVSYITGNHAQTEGMVQNVLMLLLDYLTSNISANEVTR